MMITNTSQSRMCTNKWTFCPRHNYYKYDKGCVNHPLNKIELFFLLAMRFLYLQVRMDKYHTVT